MNTTLNKSKGAENQVFFIDRKWLIGFVAIGLCACVYFVSVEEKQKVKLDDVIDKLNTLQTPTKGGDIDWGNPSPVKPSASASKPDSTLISAPGGASPKADTPVDPGPAPKTPDTAASTPAVPDIDKDPISISKLANNLNVARNRMIDRIRNDYGTYYEDLFTKNGVSRGRTIFKSPRTNGGGPSWNRLKRKFMTKILQVVTASQKKSSSTPGSSEDTHNVSVIWATGGHSSAAGHGNFYDESYTARMERLVVDVFDSVGIQFIGKNYAMGGTQSSPEVASCMEAIFGYPDILSWDFGMTEVGHDHMISHYCLRGAMQKNRAACVGIRMGRDRGKVIGLEELEKVGMTAFVADEDVFQEVNSLLPDSQALSQIEVDKLPPFIRNFKCGATIESGDPLCGTEKWNETFCAVRQAKNSWHPGWKWHALDGSLLALFLVEVLDDAMKSIVADSTDPTKLLAKLQEEDDGDFSQLQKADIPQNLKDLKVENDPLELAERRVVFKAPAVCHTARLPAETRFRGILTESNQTGFYTYDDGFAEEEATKFTVGNSSLARLIRDDGHRQQCEVQLNVDYKDYFYVNYLEGTRSVIVPNNAELKEYGPRAGLKGMIAVCMVVCDWNQCPEGTLLTKDLISGDGSLEINGVKVTGSTKIYTCDILKHAGGFYFAPDAAGKFKLDFRANKEKSYVRFGAVIVW